MVDKALAALCVSFSLRYTDVTCMYSVVVLFNDTVTDKGECGKSTKTSLYCAPFSPWTFPVQPVNTND